jgi:hypothetical protein
MTERLKFGAAEGADFSDMCKDPGCPCCAIWPASGEDRAAWLARLGREYREAPMILKHGDALPQSRLTGPQVRAMRAAHPNGANGEDEKALAATYGVGRMTIRDALAGRTWRAR